MITFRRLHIEGFCSIGERLELTMENSISLLSGRNGVGKTTILSALCWVLFGKTTKGVSDVNTWESLRPSGYQGTKVTVWFTDDKHTYLITRCQNYKGEILGAKGKDRLVLMIDAEETEEKKKYFIQGEIEKVLGMNWAIFINSVMFGQGMQRLIQYPGSDIKKIFEDIFDLNYIQIARNIAQEELNTLTTEYRILKNDKEKIEWKIEANKDKLEQSKILLKKVKGEEEKRSLEYRKTIKRAKGKIKELKTELGALIKKKESYNKRKMGILETYDKYIRSKVRLNDIPDLIKWVDSLMLLVGLGYETQLLEELQKFKNDLQPDEKTLKLFAKVKKVTNKLDTYSREITALQFRVDNGQEHIKSLKTTKHVKSEIDIDLKPVKKELRVLRKEVEEINDKLKGLEKPLKDYNWLIKEPLGNKGIKSFIIESCLSDLNMYLEQFTNDLEIKVEFGVDLSSTKKDFYTLIEKEGVICNYDELSGGQKQLVNIAMAFSLHKIVTDTNKINILFLDELFESLSEDNIEKVIPLLKQMSDGKALFLITHHSSLPINGAKIVNISSKEGLTYIEK